MQRYEARKGKKLILTMQLMAWLWHCVMRVDVTEKLTEMHFVYVLQSLKDNKLYTGYTSDLKKRLKKHNSGLVKSTKSRRPFKLIYCEASLSKKDALKREIYLKTSWGKRYIKNRSRNYLDEKQLATVR